MPEDPFKKFQVPINLDLVKKIQELVISTTEECVKLETEDCPVSEIAGYLVGVLLQEAVFVGNKMHISYDMLQIMLESSYLGVTKQNKLSLVVDTPQQQLQDLDKNIPEINVKPIKGSN